MGGVGTLLMVLLPLGGCATAKDFHGIEVTRAPATRRLSADGMATRAAASVATVTTDVGRGMAFVVDETGYLVTNRHVLEQADHVESVIFPAYDPPLEFHGVEVVYIDPVDDLALLRVRPRDGVELTALPLAVRGDAPLAEYLQRDDQIMLLSPDAGAGDDPQAAARGLFAHVGAVSDLDVENPAVGPGPFLGITSTVQRGQSGGPVLDRYGRVVGIVTWTWRDRPGGFAIPVASVSRMLATRPVLDDLDDHRDRVSARAEAFLASLGAQEYDQAREITAPSHARKVRAQTLEVLMERLSPAILEGFVEALDTLLSKSIASERDPFLQLSALVGNLGSEESLEVLEVEGVLSREQVVTFFFELGQAYLAGRLFADLERDRALSLALERIESLDAARSFALADVLGPLGRPGVRIQQVVITPGIYGPRATVTVQLPPDLQGELGRTIGPQGSGSRVVLQMNLEWGDWYVGDVQRVSPGLAVDVARARPHPVALRRR